MAKRKPVASNGSADCTVTAVMEPRKLSEVMATNWTGRITTAIEKREAAQARFIRAAENGYTQDGWIASEMEWFHEASATERTWREAESIRREQGFAAVILWATTERNRMVDFQSWRSNSTCPWRNVASTTDVNATLRALGGRLDSIINNAQLILDGLKDGSIIDDTDHP